MITTTSPGGIGKNILIFRHRLKMTQAEFIDMFLKSEDDKAMISVAKLSNIETKGNRDEERIARLIAERVGLDPEAFLKEPAEFETEIDAFLAHFKITEAGASPCFEEKTNGRHSYSNGVLEVLSDYIAANITAGKIHAGDRLPGDRTLAELIGVSRSAVREALKVLGAIGVVNIQPGSGVYLAKDTSEIFTLPFSWTILLSTDSSQNVYQLRALIEKETVRLTTERRSTPAFDAIRSVIEREERMLKNENYKEMLRCDTEFHMGIAYCAGNDILTNLLLTCRKMLSFLNALGMSTMSQIQEMHKEHSELYAAMERGDADLAQQLITKHLRCTEQRYRGRK